MFTFYYRAKKFCVQDGATIENRLRDPIMQSEFMNWKCMDRIRKKDFNVIRL